MCGAKDWAGGPQEIEVHQQAALQECELHQKYSTVSVLQVETFTENQQLTPRCPQKDSSEVCWTQRVIFIQQGDIKEMQEGRG